MIKRIISFVFLISILQSNFIFSQETIYSDEILNDYVNLETLITEKLNNNAISTDDIEKIQAMKNSLEGENRPEIISRLEMLYFLVKIELKNNIINENSEQILNIISLDEKRYKQKEDTKTLKKTVIGTAIGTTIVMGGLYAFSTTMASNYYNFYSQAETSEDAAFYLYSWPILDSISLVSGIITILAALTAGIMGAVY